MQQHSGAKPYGNNVRSHWQPTKKPATNFKPFCKSDELPKDHKYEYFEDDRMDYSLGFIDFFTDEYKKAMTYENPNKPPKLKEETKITNCNKPNDWDDRLEFSNKENQEWMERLPEEVKEVYELCKRGLLKVKLKELKKLDKKQIKKKKKALGQLKNSKKFNKVNPNDLSLTINWN